MGIFIEVRCDSGRSDGCHSDRSRNPVRYVTQEGVKEALESLLRTAKETGWEMGENSICPACKGHQDAETKS